MQTRQLLLKYNLHHLFIWMLIFGLWFFLRYQDYASEATAYKVTLVKVLDLAMLVYITNYLLIPKLLYRKRYFWFIVTFIVMIVCSSILKMNILGRIMNAPAYYNLTENLKVRIYDNVIPHFFLVTAGAAIKLISDHFKMQKHMAEMAREKAEAELNFLKSQINPHFLFNSLNSVYFLIDKDNPDARTALHKFSDMLRYQLYECNDEKIPIEKELTYLRDYVDLQRLRREAKDEVIFECSDEVQGFMIEPLLLIPFVENSFKHLSHFNKDKANLVRIEADRNNGEFSFRVSNTVDYNSTREPMGGIGLKNVKRRLELLYPGKHELNIKEEGGVFSIGLKLKIQ